MSGPFQLASRIRCGTIIGGQTGDAVRDQARAIEAAGFDSAWVGDHVAFYAPIMESLTTLAFAAGATSRVQLGTSIYLVPLRHPTTSAKVAATLDVLSGGRLLLGIGVGGEFPPEFEACGVPLAERGPRTDESIAIMRRLWTEGAVAHAGEHFRFGEVDVAPKPLQPGGPPILVGGRKAASMRRAGCLGDGYISHMCSPEHFARNMQTIAEHAVAAGREGVPFESVCFIFTVMDDDYERAADKAGSMLSSIYNIDMRAAARRYCLLGRPEDILEQMQAFVKSGARHFSFSLLSDPAAFYRAYRDVLLPGLAQIDLA
jgi:probable F420-dependent oxidoreductase